MSEKSKRSGPIDAFIKRPRLNGVDGKNENADESDKNPALAVADVPQSEWRVRVARYQHGTLKPPHRSNDGYINVLIHTRDPLSPYVMRDEHGCILENVWQFAKFYRHVTTQRIAKHHMRPNDVVWQHPAEKHIETNDPLQMTDAYWLWRQKGMQNDYAVRYPNGFYGRKTVVGALWPVTDSASQNSATGDLRKTTTGPDGTVYEVLDYITSRKKIYCGLYARLVETDREFARLTDLLRSGEKLQLWEVDGPDWRWPEEPFTALTKTQPGLDMHDIATVRRLLHDEKHPFGHGYTIAALLLHGNAWLDD